MTVRRLAELSWPEVPAGSLLVVPIGSCEQHGPHLPMDTDLRIAVALAEALATRRADVVVAPSITVAASGEHQSFPGTLSIGTLAPEAAVVELVRSALPPPGSTLPRPFDAVVLVNGHGGNVEALQRAEALLVDEGRQVLVWHPSVPGGDSHAGRSETSLLLHLDPACVRRDRLEAGSTERWRDIGERVVADGLAAVSPNGVLGDPTGADATHGAELFAALVDSLERAVGSWRTSGQQSGAQRGE